MLNPQEPPYIRYLDDGLTLRTIDSAQDIERIAEFNGIIHGAQVATMTRRLFNDHPNMTGRDMPFIEDSNGQVIASLCLIPWKLNFGNIELNSGEMGIVGTLETYRNRGLFRQLDFYFKQRLRERGCLLSHIQGIPYFYRKFGYEYAIPLDGGWRIEGHQIPDEPGPAHLIRSATPEDITVLARLYEETSQLSFVHAVRSQAIWEYLLTPSDPNDATMHENLVVEKSDSEILDYFRLPTFHFGDQLVVDEASQTLFDSAMVVLQFLKKLMLERNKPGIRLNLPENSNLVKVAQSLGAQHLGYYAWQWYIPDVLSVLVALRPVFEKRIAASIFAGLTRSVLINLYREVIEFDFRSGHLIQISNLGKAKKDAALNIPLQAFIPLLFGYKSIPQLKQFYPDISTWPSWNLLYETLFPKMDSFLYSIY